MLTRILENAPCKATLDAKKIYENVLKYTNGLGIPHPNNSTSKTTKLITVYLAYIYLQQVYQPPVTILTIENFVAMATS